MLSAGELPRVLFVTPAAFNRTTGGGITFGNLFAGWPKDRIATAHSDPVPTTDETCERYYRLGSAELRRWGPLERIAPATATRLASAAQDMRTSDRRLARIVKLMLFGEQLPDTGRVSPQLEKWVEEFRPELLYTILGTNSMMELVLDVQRRFHLPVVAHMMDDWPAASYRGGLLGPVARHRMQRLLSEVMKRASLRLGICDAMCDAYAKRYGLPFESFQNTVDSARWNPLAKQSFGPEGQGDIVYVGSVLPFAQLESLIDCCQAVAQLGREGLPVRLTIYSPAMYAEPYRKRIAIAPNIVLHDAITDDEAFFRRMGAADILLLPVNFDAHTARYIRYSMPTKVPAYLLSGTPILAYGPDDVAQIRYALEHDWAYVVSRRDTRELAAGIRSMLSDSSLRKRLSANARRTALERHDADNVRQRFREALIQAARGGAPVSLG